MKNIRELTEHEIKTALYQISEGRSPSGIEPDVRALRIALFEKTGETLGYHEQPYLNENNRCNCFVCELVVTCPYADRYQRLPREYYPGAMSLCKKIN